MKDNRFHYEPINSFIPNDNPFEQFTLGQKKMSYPIWISSMTGGTAFASTINSRLAIVAEEFGFGMGLGSCRQLLYNDERLADFDVRSHMPSTPLFANLGIAQIEEILVKGRLDLIDQMISKLNADGLIIHVNLLQEWLQPEGDKISSAPIDIIKRFLNESNHTVIVKEVGQGMGPKSLATLLELPIEAIEFAALGGTNFSKLELTRGEDLKESALDPVSRVGHDFNEMIQWTNKISNQNNAQIQCKKLIISGGIKNFLDGYYCIEKSNLPAVYGMASGFLKYAMEGIDELRKFSELQIKGLHMAKSLLCVKEDE